MIDHLYFYTYFISAASSVLLFYGIQMLVSAHKFSELRIANVIF